MSRGLNKVLIIGNLGRDPELRYTKSGTPVVNLSVATTHVEKSPEGEQREVTEWHRISVFGKQAEYCNRYLKKGRQIFVEGRLRTRKWEDRTGQTRYTTEILADRVMFLGSRSGADSVQQTVRDDLLEPIPDYIEEGMPDEDEIPF